MGARGGVWAKLVFYASTALVQAAQPLCQLAQPRMARVAASRERARRAPIQRSRRAAARRGGPRLRLYGGGVMRPLRMFVAKDVICSEYM